MTSKVRVLVVDDDDFIREGLTELLKRNGYSVKTAASGEKALPIVNGDGCDLVITDLKMQGMSGLELLREIKRNNPPLSVILITAFATVETAVEAMRHGASDFVTKPFDVEDLLRIVRTNSPSIGDLRESDRLVHNDTRDRIYQCISLNPGLHYRGIQSELLLGNGVLNYHLRLMEDKGLIRSKREGIYRRYYIITVGEEQHRKKRYSRNQHRIIQLAEERPGILQSEIAKELGLSRQLTNYHVNRLIRMGVLRSKKERGSNRFGIYR